MNCGIRTVNRKLLLDSDRITPLSPANTGFEIFRDPSRSLHCGLRAQARFAGRNKLAKNFLQILPRKRAFDFCNLFGRSGRDDMTPTDPALGAEVDDVIGGLDDVHVVFDY